MRFIPCRKRSKQQQWLCCRSKVRQLKSGCKRLLKMTRSTIKHRSCHLLCKTRLPLFTRFGACEPVSGCLGKSGAHTLLATAHLQQRMTHILRIHGGAVKTFNGLAQTQHLIGTLRDQGAMSRQKLWEAVKDTSGIKSQTHMTKLLKILKVSCFSTCSCTHHSLGGWSNSNNT